MTSPRSDAPTDEPEIAIGGREQLVHLLAEASEIEHTLMCSYLFAAFSLRTGEMGGLSSEELSAVERWRSAIIRVAMDEMVHLLLVSNLSIAIGGRPHFGRPNFPVEPGYFPADVVVRLKSFSEDTLDHFVYLERPKGFELEDGEGFRPPADYMREEAYHGLMPTIQDYATVGRLYEALRENLVASSRRLGEHGLFIGPVAGQVGKDAVDLDGVATVDGLEAALRAIDTIVEQGEGSSADRSDSHYQSFRAMRREFQQLRKNNPAFEPAWPVADNPVMRRPPNPADKTFIDDPNAARVLDLANAIYGLLLQLIVQGFGRTGAGAKQGQTRALDAAITLMHALSKLGDALARLPASSTTPELNAGLTFTMSRSVEPIFTGVAEDRLIHERLTELAAGARMASRLAPGLRDLDRQIESVAAAFDPKAARPAEPV